jgi:hypothetical protein
MGFLDKAKKLAEQAQSKLDEVQKQVNTGSSQPAPSGPAVEYDKHGRPIPQQQTASPPHGDPLTGGPAAPPSSERSGGEPAGRDSGPIPDPSAPAAPSSGDPLAGPHTPPPPAQGGWSAPAPPPPSPPIASNPAATPGVPPTEPPSGPPAPVEGSVPPPAAPGVPSSSPAAGPATPGDEEEDANQSSYAPPKMTGGDPLAG